MKIKYRTWYKGTAPQPIKLEIPGWAGESTDHSDGNKPMPWHCVPFVEGSTYGYELIYPFDSECHVTTKNGKTEFKCDFSKEWDAGLAGCNWPPFSGFAPNHYGMSSSLDVESPENYCCRLESHPRFYTDRTGTVPIVVPGHIHRWWSRIFFVAFKSPLEGETHIFRKNEAYAQILIVPINTNMQLEEMTSQESLTRTLREDKISKNSQKIASHVWKDHLGNNFDDKYKQLKSIYKKGGYKSVDENLNKLSNKESKCPMMGRFVKNDSNN